MGEMADYYIALGLNTGEGFAPKYRERRLYYGPRYSQSYSTKQPKKPKCNTCNSKDVHWRFVDGGFKLFENQRQHPGNRYVPHFCPTSAEGFEDCSS